MLSYSIVRAVIGLVDLYSTLIIVYCLMSWIPRGNGGLLEDARGVLGAVCEPYLGLFRRIIPPIAMMDFSPIVAILVLQMVARLITAIL